MQYEKQETGSSFHSLPIEITSQIFLDGTQKWRDFEPQALPFPALVSGVCSHWRNVSEGMPELWTFILPPLHKEIDECLEWTSKWLERSGTMHVSIVLDDLVVTMDIEGEIASLTERKIARTLTLLSKHRHRLRRLDIRSATIGAFKKFMRDLWDIPNLEQLSLCARKDYATGFLFSGNDQRSMKWSTLRDLPSLTKFRFQHISPPCIPILTSLTAHRLLIDYEGIKTLFSNTPNLAHLVLHELPPGPYMQDPANCMPIKAPSLRSIAVETAEWYHDSVAQFSLFNYMTIPNLVYLEIKRGYNAWRFDALFGSSLSESLATIKKLRIANMKELGDNIKFLHSLYGLEELEIVQAPASELFQRPEVPNRYMESSQVVWPQLRSITMDTPDLNSLMSSVDLIDMRAGFPHYRIHNFYLSRSSMQLLTEGDETSKGRARFRTRLGSKGGKDWLNKLVELRSFEGPCYGLLDDDRVPLAQIS